MSHFVLASDASTSEREFFDKYVYWSSHSKITFCNTWENLYYTGILYEWNFEHLNGYYFKINFSSNIYTFSNTIGTFSSYNKS